jgi:hypothetical protein
MTLLDFDRVACALGIRARNEGGNRDEIELQICGGHSGPPQLPRSSFLLIGVVT